MHMIMNIVVSALKKVGAGLSSLSKDDNGIGVVEVILILVEKPNAKHRYVLCGN